MDDRAWLASRTWAFYADSAFAATGLEASALTSFHGLVVAPTDIPAATRATHVDAGADADADATTAHRATAVAAVAGYPTGRHHTLIKAAEARLAIQAGAHEVWVCVDPFIADLNSHLADLVAIRDACPPPARLGLFLAAWELGSASGASVRDLVHAAAQAGFDSVIASTGQLEAGLGATHGMDVVAFSLADEEDLDGQVRALEQAVHAGAEGARAARAGSAGAGAAPAGAASAGTTPADAMVHWATSWLAVCPA